MKNNDRKPLTIFYPIMLAVMLVLGIYLGSHFASSNPATITTRFLPLPAFGKVNKIGQILEYVDEQYVDTVAREKLIDKAISSILEELDPHSYYISASEMASYTEPLEGNFDGIGVEFMILKDTVRVVNPIEGGPSEKLGIQAGDKIVKVEGEIIAGVEITNEKVMKLLRGPSSTVVNVEIERPGLEKPLTFAIERGKIPIYSVAASLMLENNTGYIKISRFARTTYEEFMAAVSKLQAQGMERIIIDLRGNGGGYLTAAIRTTEEFLSKGQLIVYTEGKSQPRKSYYSSKSGILSEMPTAVIINEGSASASEIMAGAIQDSDRGIIIGRRSFGKGLVQEQLPLSDNSALRLTVARYYTPTGRSIQKPYGSGIDYENDYMSRLQHGELLFSDSIHFDDSLSFVTPGGKVVYGGGGIMPDVFVPMDTAGASYYLTEISYAGLINSFAFEYANNNRESLRKFEDYNTFKSEFKGGDKLLNQFADYAERQGIKKDKEGQKNSKEVIEIRLKAAIARNLWGNEAFYAIILDDDNVMRETMKVMGDARQTDPALEMEISPGDSIQEIN